MNVNLIMFNTNFNLCIESTYFNSENISVINSIHGYASVQVIRKLISPIKASLVD